MLEADVEQTKKRLVQLSEWFNWPPLKFALPLIGCSKIKLTLCTKQAQQFVYLK